MSAIPIVLAFGSNVGDRVRWLRDGIRRVRPFVSVVRISSVWEAEPIAAPPGSPSFLNLVAAGVTHLRPETLLATLHEVEAAMGRTRRLRNEPRIIDIDLIFYDCHRSRSESLMLPHPRFRERAFVTEPLQELGLGWVDPGTGEDLRGLRGGGVVARVGSLFGFSRLRGLV